MTYIAKRSAGASGAPLLLTFHGTGGTEAQFHDFGQSALPNAHVVSPRGDVTENGALRFFHRTSEGVYDMGDLARATRNMAAFIATETQRTGAARVIGLGYSNGANILASVALSNPDLVSDIILLHPLIPWTPAPNPGLEGKRVLITAGMADPICPTHLTDGLTDYLEDQGADLTVFRHQGGHELAAAEIDAVHRFIA